jgi:hypothetical protein
VPLCPSVTFAVYGLYRSAELIRESIFARDDADLLAKLGSLCRKRVYVEAVSCRLASRLTKSFDEFLLLFWSDGCVSEEDNASL